MSAQEFGEWQVFMRFEQLHPAAMRLRHAQLQALALHGPATRRGGKPWTAADFMPADPWAEPAADATAVAGRKSARKVNVVDQVRALNALRRRR